MKTNRSSVLVLLTCLCAGWGCRIDRQGAADPRRDGVNVDGGKPNAPMAEEVVDGSERGGPPATSHVDLPSSTGGDANTGTHASESMHADAAADRGAGLMCAPPKVDVCNPITNEGCLMELGMHCAVDPLAGTLAGFCIFSAPMDGGGDCLNTLVTESCPPSSTCFEGRCRKLCFCNGDCAQGQCCVERIGDLGFKACGKC